MFWDPITIRWMEMTRIFMANLSLALNNQLVIIAIYHVWTWINLCELNILGFFKRFMISAGIQKTVLWRCVHLTIKNIINVQYVKVSVCKHRWWGNGKRGKHGKLTIHQEGRKFKLITRKDDKLKRDEDWNNTKW